MKLYFGDEIQCRCNLSTCRSKRSIRKGTWFESSRLSVLKCLRFIYGWSEELTSVKWCEKQLEISHGTVVDWNNYMREVCVDSLLKRQQRKIGGPGMIVEVDESMFTKRKNNAGRILPQQWIFGGVCRETNECFLVMVPNRSMSIILEAINENIEKGTTIYSDSWKSYCTEKLEEESFEHFKVNHKYNFVDPETGTHTQKIERLWGSAKWRNKKHRGTARHHLESYLAGFMWRKNTKDPFEKKRY
ncbi:uncharacterized protein LOC118197352 [Stegodyphus dumicola]|uniref:uncharacterized protein LOC118197352 n=1 Tax=Stegodyphus dumicola TaxID=202533 RepID=UPI0015A76D32|nr:uncharacterized protein LOC118197352 [Stegodyphus dumicola]